MFSLVMNRARELASVFADLSATWNLFTCQTLMQCQNIDQASQGKFTTLLILLIFKEMIHT